MMIKKTLSHKSWLIPFLITLLITPFTPFLDLKIAHYFQGDEMGQFSTHPFFNFVYTWALLPGQILIIFSLLAWVFSIFFPRFQAWRPASLYLILTITLGAGIISHAILKDHWGRPRPKQVVEFGGKQPFRALWQPNFFHQPEPSKSFPCGHCTMGFYFFSLIFLGWRYQKKTLLLSGVILTAFLGISLSIARMAQGGHFFSDVLYSAFIMWITCLVCDRWIFSQKNEKG